MNGTIRLPKLPLPAKLLITLFVLIIGPGYLFGTANILYKHQDADGEPGLTINDLKATFHGLTRTYKPEDKVTVNSEMLIQVHPDGEMREYLEEGGEPAIRGLITWLEQEAKEADFAKEGLVQEGDPSAQAIITAHCVECHNADGGDNEDLPFADTADEEAQFKLVDVASKAEINREESGEVTQEFKPTGTSRLIHITHVHILSMPVFTFIVGCLFLMTGVSDKLKLLIGPLPMLAVMLDIGGWWLARWIEPFIYVIGAAGGLFGTMYALQILCILGSLWVGKSSE